MKKLQLLSLTFLLLLFLACNREDQKQESSGAASAEAVKTEKNAQKDVYEDDTPQPFEDEAPDVNDDKVILEINDQTYTNKNLKAFLKRRYSGASMSEIRNNPRVMSRIYDTYTEDTMVLYMVNKENLQLSQDEIDNYLKDKHMSGEKVDEAAVLDSARVYKYLFQTIYKDIDVSDSEIRQYFQQNIEQYRKEEEVQLHQIVVRESSKADEIRRELIKSPHTFADVAARESQSREGANGGNMGYFARGILPKDMEDVVFSLEIDAISPVVKSPYGYHIFKVTKKKNKRLMGIDAVEPEIRNTLLSDKMNEAYLNFLKQLKKQLTVKTRYENLFFTYQAVKKGE